MLDDDGWIMDVLNFHRWLQNERIMGNPQTVEKQQVTLKVETMLLKVMVCVSEKLCISLLV